MRGSGRAFSIIAVVFIFILAPGAWAAPATTPGGGPQAREGFWIGFGLGYGSADRSCDRAACQQDRVGSITGFLKLGGTLNPRVLAGVEGNVWSKKEEGVSNLLGNLTATATFYPFVSSGFFVKGGVGLSYASRETRTGTRLNQPVDAKIKFSSVGAGVLAGLGYDLRVEIPGTQHHLRCRQNQWVVRGGVGFRLENPSGIAHDLPGSPMDLGHTTDAIGILDPRVVVPVGFPDLGIGQ